MTVIHPFQYRQRNWKAKPKRYFAFQRRDFNEKLKTLVFSTENSLQRRLASDISNLPFGLLKFSAADIKRVNILNTIFTHVKDIPYIHIMPRNISLLILIANIIIHRLQGWLMMHYVSHETIYQGLLTVNYLHITKF